MVILRANNAPRIRRSHVARNNLNPIWVDSGAQHEMIMHKNRTAFLLFYRFLKEGITLINDLNRNEIESAILTVYGNIGDNQISGRRTFKSREPGG